MCVCVYVRGWQTAYVCIVFTSSLLKHQRTSHTCDIWLSFVSLFLQNVLNDSYASMPRRIRCPAVELEACQSGCETAPRYGSDRNFPSPHYQHQTSWVIAITSARMLRATAVSPFLRRSEVLWMAPLWICAACCLRCKPAQPARVALIMRFLYLSDWVIGWRLWANPPLSSGVTQTHGGLEPNAMCNDDATLEPRLTDSHRAESCSWKTKTGSERTWSNMCMRGDTMRTWPFGR